MADQQGRLTVRHVLVPVVAAVVLAGGTGCGPTPTADAGGHPVPAWAGRLCNKHEPTERPVIAVLINMTTAGDLTRHLKAQNAPTAPWSRLPSRHRVVECTFSFDTDPNAPAPTVTRCPDGEDYATGDLEQASYAVDRDGRTSRIDKLMTPAGTDDPCA
ncbi:MAG: hypothetical protein ACRDV1_12175 [Actinomycetes bacterium]